MIRPANDPSLHNDPSRGFLALRSGAHRAGGWKIRLGPVNISLLRSGAHRAGGWKIRLGDFLLSGVALTGLGSERSVSEQGF